MRRALVALLALAALAGCSGGDDDGEAATVETSPATTGPRFQSRTTANAVMGRTLLRFVRAAARGDAAAMWAELSVPTRESIGPTLADFEAGHAVELRRALRTLAPSARVVLSRQIGSHFGVAAILGSRVVRGEREEFAYGAALVDEGARWKLELGGIFVSGFVPEPLQVAEPDTRIASDVGAADGLSELHMWLDGKPLRVRTEGETPFTAELAATPDAPLRPGTHVAVTFAATSETATATAWPFTVERG